MLMLVRVPLNATRYIRQAKRATFVIVWFGLSREKEAAGAAR